MIRTFKLNRYKLNKIINETEVMVSIKALRLVFNKLLSNPCYVVDLDWIAITRRSCSWLTSALMYCHTDKYWWEYVKYETFNGEIRWYLNGCWWLNLHSIQHLWHLKRTKCISEHDDTFEFIYKSLYHK